MCHFFVLISLQVVHTVLCVVCLCMLLTRSSWPLASRSYLLTAVHTCVYFSSELISVALIQKSPMEIFPPQTQNLFCLLVSWLYAFTILCVIYEDKKGRGQMFLEKRGFHDKTFWHRPLKLAETIFYVFSLFNFSFPYNLWAFT